MKNISVFILILLVNLSAFADPADCLNFSGTYKSKNSSTIVTLTQTQCDSIVITNKNNQSFELILDTQEHEGIAQGASFTYYKAGFFGSSLISRTKIYTDSSKSILKVTSLIVMRFDGADLVQQIETLFADEEPTIKTERWIRQ